MTFEADFVQTRARPSLQRLTWVSIVLRLRVWAYVFLIAQDFPAFFSEWPRTAIPAATAA